MSVSSVRTNEIEHTNDDDDDFYAKGAHFSILTSNLKLFTRSITSLSRLGDELILEPSEKGLKLKTYNRNKLAYGIFCFHNEFFNHADSRLIDDDATKNICRIRMKCALSVFKTVQYIDKNCTKCELRIDPRGDTCIVRLQLSYDVTRTYTLPLMGTTIPVARREDVNGLKNVAVLPAEHLSHCLAQLRSDADELIMHASQSCFLLRNYVINGDNKTAMRTDAQVDKNCFTKYHIPRPTELIFNLKDFKAVVSFADAHAAPITLRFGLPGQSLIICLDNDVDGSYTCEFRIATLETDYVPPAAERSATANVTTAQTLTGSGGEERVERGRGGGGAIARAQSAAAAMTLLESPLRSAPNVTHVSPSTGSQRADRQPEAEQHMDMEQDAPVENEQMDMDGGMAMAMDGLDETRPPQQQQGQQGEEEEDDVLPPDSPPPTVNKRMRKYFLSSSQQTQHQSQLGRRGIPLADETQMR